MPEARRMAPDCPKVRCQFLTTKPSTKLIKKKSKKSSMSPSVAAPAISHWFLVNFCCCSSSCSITIPPRYSASAGSPLHAFTAISDSRATTLSQARHFGYAQSALLFGRLRRGQLHRVRPVAVAERLSVDLFEEDLAGQHLFLPVFLVGDAAMKLRHHLAGEQFEALADVFVGVLAGLVEEDHRVDVRRFKTLQFAPKRRRRADEAAGQRAGQCLGVGALPLLVFVPQIDRARRRPLAVDALAVKTQRKLEERDAVGAAPRLLVSL